MAYVIRFSPNIEADIRRGWSAWMTARDADLESLITTFFPHDPDDIEAAWERWQDESHATWHKRDHTDREAFLEDYAEGQGWDIRHDDVAGQWCMVHHDGLSCFSLEAATEAGAIAEARQMAPGIGDFTSGDQTDGAVRLVHSEPGEDWHVLECQGVWKEDF